MSDKPWIRWIALGLAMILVAGGVARWTFVSELLLGLGTVSLVIGAGVAILPMLRRSRDPYDLGKLQKVHEQLELKEAETAFVNNDAEIVCPSCFEPYSQKLPSCPRCGRLP